MEKPGETFFFIPHTHWEGAVFKTREEYLQMGLPNILRALQLLKQYPEYRFVLDQACYVRPFLERFPEQEAAFRQFAAEGRLAIVGGTDVMLDVNMPGGESFVRQVLYGKGYFRQKLGLEVTVGWPLDTFGHHAQMPQLLRLAGFRSYWFFRGVPDWETPAEFFWQGLDGTRIPAFWLPHGYAITYASPKTLPEFEQFFKQQYVALQPFARSHLRVGLAGADVCEPEDHVPPLVEQFNARQQPFQLRIATPAEYEAAVEQSGMERTVLQGELNPIFQGIYSSRIELKQRTRELERLLLTAEKLGVLLGWMGEGAHGDLWPAWEPMLFNQAHDLMSGVMTDHVYEDVLRGYDFAARFGREALAERLAMLAERVDTRPTGAEALHQDALALVVFNSLAWARTEVVEVEVGFGGGGVTALALTDADGVSVPLQILEAERCANGDLLRARLAFLARAVPAMGYAVYHLTPAQAGDADAQETVALEGAWIENEFYRLTFDPLSGAIQDLWDKEGGWHY